MDVYEAFRRRSLRTISRYSAEFQRVFKRDLMYYVCDTEAEGGGLRFSSFRRSGFPTS